ncbi:MAG: hypothetical protein KUG76_01480 [Gammaproteobacteria bacterium]|nr:hypothetical protein [Gammaproteobacteria bacterium]
MKTKLFVVFILISACSIINGSERYKNEENERSTLLSSLLNLDKEEYTYIDAKGEKQSDSLKAFKELERIYIKNIKPDLPNNKLSVKRLKIIMFYSFYAHEKKSGAFQEYLASDLMPVFIDNTDEFLRILKQLPFLTVSNCNRLNASFGFEGKHAINKNKFLKEYEIYFKDNLDLNQYKACIDNFNAKPNR